MKQIPIVLIVMLIPALGWALPGEFVIESSGANVQLTLHLKSTGGNAWKLDANTGQVIVDTSYDETFTDYSFGFDSPDDVNTGKDGVRRLQQVLRIHSNRWA